MPVPVAAAMSSVGPVPNTTADFLSSPHGRATSKCKGMMVANEAAVSKGDGKCGVGLHQGPHLTRDWGDSVEIEAEPAVL